MNLRMLWNLSAIFALAAGVAQAVAQTALPAVGAGGGAVLPARANFPPVIRRDNPVTSIQEFVRIEGHNRYPMRGVGIVTGLAGSGDSGKELILARPLAQIYQNNGIAIPKLEELAAAKSAAIVTLSCDLPEGGGKKGDLFDVYVQVSHSAKSLRGGTLVISPLSGPFPGDPPLAMASGPIVLEESDIPTSGRIRLGAQLLEDVRPRPVGNSFNLIIKPYYRSFATARTLATEINGITADLESPDDVAETIATPIDDSTIRVVIPPNERANPSNFIANVLTKRFSPSLIDLPAMVVVNERTGSIVVTGDVEISAVTVGNDRLIVTTTNPPPIPSPQDPIVSRENWTEFGSTSTNADRSRIEDLLEAFKRLNVPVKEQISILAQINETGRLHARFIRE